MTATAFMPVGVCPAVRLRVRRGCFPEQQGHPHPPRPLNLLFRAVLVGGWRVPDLADVVNIFPWAGAVGGAVSGRGSRTARCGRV